MKAIIAGSRNINDGAFVFNILDTIAYHLKITEVVSGHCDGVDLLGEKWARGRKLPIERFPAEWRKYGPAAGPIRNTDMAEYADLAVVIHAGSRGSRDMVRKMLARNKTVREFVVIRNEETGGYEIVQDVAHNPTPQKTKGT